jgi:hypothetical protein
MPSTEITSHRPPPPRLSNVTRAMSDVSIASERVGARHPANASSETSNRTLANRTGPPRTPSTPSHPSARGGSSHPGASASALPPSPISPTTPAPPRGRPPSPPRAPQSYANNTRGRYGERDTYIPQYSDSSPERNDSRDGEQPQSKRPRTNRQNSSRRV